MIVNRDPGDEHTARNEPVAVNSKLERPFELPPAAVSETEPERAAVVTTPGGSLAAGPLG
jgi:hypothetical protein